MELALWTHYVASELKPELLEGLPSYTANNVHVPVTANNDSDSEQQNNDTNNTSANEITTTTTNNSTAVAAAVTTTTTTNTINTNGVPPSIEASDESNLEPAQPIQQPQNGNNGKGMIGLDQSWSILIQQFNNKMNTNKTNNNQLQELSIV